MPASATKTYFRYFPVAQRDRDWGLYVTTAGESRIAPGSNYPPTAHPGSYDFLTVQGRRLDEFQLIYISAGQGWFKSDATGRVLIEAGNVMLLFPGVWHTYAPADTTGWNEHWLGFNGETARRLVVNGFFGPQNPVLPAGQERRVLALFNDALEAVRNNQPALQQILASSVTSLLALIYSFQQSRLAGDDPGLKAIQEAVSRMRRAPEAELNMELLARELKVGYRWFRRAFTHHTGLSPHQYFLDVRLARARELLLQTTLPTKEIAARVGFADEHYFCRLFHKKIGASPGLWRERARRGKRS